jgi:hypothetical protein
MRSHEFVSRLPSPVIPALTFGEQLADDTEGHFNGVHVLFSTAICGIMQAIVGGQPLVIVGVAEPIGILAIWQISTRAQTAPPGRQASHTNATTQCQARHRC